MKDEEQNLSINSPCKNKIKGNAGERLDSADIDTDSDIVHDDKTVVGTVSPVITWQGGPVRTFSLLFISQTIHVRPM